MTPGAKLIVEFDDVILPDESYGDEWYEVNLKSGGE